MKKWIIISVLMFILSVHVDSARGEGHKEFELKQGAHRSAVNKKYGEPIITEKLESGFLPIPREKALYKIDSSTYVMLRFFSGRVHDIMVLEDVDSEKALSLFKK